MTELLKKEKPSLNRFYILLVLAIAVIVAGWFLLERGKATSEIRNVLLISIDTCRADHLSCYGYSRQTTPNIDAVADEAVIFNHAVTTAPLTLPAHSSMLTGTIPLHHGVHDNYDYKLGQSNVTLAEILHQHDFTTAAITGAFVLDSQFGLDQGFDTYDDQLLEEQKKTPFSYSQDNERRAEEVTRLANIWLEKNHKEKFFLFLHYFDPHQEYRPPEPFATTFRDNLYAGEIAYTDCCIGRVIEKLKKLGLYDSTLIIITADHGESRGEHSEKTHGFFVYQSTIHVPLIIKVPEGAKGKKINDVAGLIDIVPTVCGLLKITPPSSVHGNDLSGLFSNQGEIERNRRHLYCESLKPTQYGCSALLGLVSDRWKYIQAPRPELYDLNDDPHEIENLADKHPKRSLLLRNHLKLILQDRIDAKEAENKLVLDKESIARLKSLGYVGGGVTEDFQFDPNKNDPKDMFRLHDQITRVSQCFSLGQYSKAKVIAEEILKEQPQSTLIHFFLGKIAFEKHDIQESLDHFSKFLARIDDTNDLHDGSKLPRYLIPNICEAHNYLGMAFSQRGHFDQAMHHYSKALQIKSTSSRVHYEIIYYNLGNALLEQNRLAKAIECYTNALNLNPDLAKAHYNIANALLRQGKPEKAIVSYKNALISIPVN